MDWQRSRTWSSAFPLAPPVPLKQSSLSFRWKSRDFLTSAASSEAFWWNSSLPAAGMWFRHLDEVQTSRACLPGADRWYIQSQTPQCRRSARNRYQQVRIGSFPQAASGDWKGKFNPSSYVVDRFLAHVFGEDRAAAPLIFIVGNSASVVYLANNVIQRLQRQLVLFIQIHANLHLRRLKCKTQHCETISDSSIMSRPPLVGEKLSDISEFSRIKMCKTSL